MRRKIKELDAKRHRTYRIFGVVRCLFAFMQLYLNYISPLLCMLLLFHPDPHDQLVRQQLDHQHLLP